MFKMIGMHKGKTEILDVFNTLQDALSHLKDYQAAYGPNWTIDIYTVALIDV